MDIKTGTKFRHTVKSPWFDGLQSQVETQVQVCEVTAVVAPVEGRPMSGRVDYRVLEVETFDNAPDFFRPERVVGLTGGIALWAVNTTHKIEVLA